MTSCLVQLVEEMLRMSRQPIVYAEKRHDDSGGGPGSMQTRGEQVEQKIASRGGKNYV